MHYAPQELMFYFLGIAYVYVVNQMIDRVDYEIIVISL